MSYMAAPPRYPRAATNNEFLFSSAQSPPCSSSSSLQCPPTATNDCVIPLSSIMHSMSSRPSELSSSTLEDLLRERTAIEPLRHAVPHLWSMLESRIAYQSNMKSLSHMNAVSIPANIPSVPATAPLSTTGPPSNSVDSISSMSTLGARLVRAQSTPLPGMQKQNDITSSFSCQSRRRVKIPIPADRFPDYNFVGRLLGPRGTTLKTLARDTCCKIMIRGKGSIRKDKEQDVRHKPGYEHVFTEPLHVVIEASDSTDDVSAMRALQRAKEAVELLLVPVPEDRDGLKRQQLRALAIMNGTYRGSLSRSCDGLPQFYEGERLPTSSSSFLLSDMSSRDVLENDARNGLQPQNYSIGLEGPLVKQSQASHTLDGNVKTHNNLNAPIFRRHHSQPIQFTNEPHDSTELYLNHGLCLEYERNNLQGVSNNEGRGYNRESTQSRNALIRQDGVPEAISANLEHVTMDDFTSSVDDTPESSPSSDDGGGGVSVSRSVDIFRMKREDASGVALSSKGPGLTDDGDIRLGVGVFMGKDFYNGAFSNQLSSETPWDVASSAALSSGAFEMNSPNVPNSQKTQAFTITENTSRETGY